MICLLSINLRSPVNSHVENKKSVNKFLISRIKERQRSVRCVLSCALNKYRRLNDIC